MQYFPIVEKTLHHIATMIHFEKEEIRSLTEATKELFTNAVTHAYHDHEGLVEIVFHPFSYGIRIDVHDWGVPMAADKYSSVPIKLEKEHGFNRIYKLVDQFDYKNLGKNGKKFSIIKYLKHPFEFSQKREDVTQQRKPKDTPIIVRRYEVGDEEAIARLIYQNYGYSYIKESFYYPRKIRELQGSKIFSIVALDANNNQIVGHFALVKMPDSNIAEIGVVVVEPRYKGLGIMNKMFDALLKEAKEVGFDAIFGEAIMYHIFSQKSNLSHGFSETALLLGRAPEDVTIENNQLTQKRLRGSVLVGYKVFHYPKQHITLPSRYNDIITQTYQNAHLPLQLVPKNKEKTHRHVHLYYTYEPLTNTATIVIDHYGKHFKHKLKLLLTQLRAKHCDMIYAEINLNNFPQIDKVVKILNKHNFFYAGILFLKHKNQDYLCLQSKHSLYVGKKNLVCYSPFCKELLEFIKTDESSIKKNRIK